MIFPTNTELDQYITDGREPLGGFPSGCIVTLVQMDTRVAATSLCRELTDPVHSFWFTDEHPAWWGMRSTNGSDSTMLQGMMLRDGTSTLKYVAGVSHLAEWILSLPEWFEYNAYIVDSVMGLQEDLVSLELLNAMPAIHKFSAEYDALVVFVTQMHHDPNTGDDYFTGEKAFKENSEYIITLDRTSDDEHTKYLASCIWSPTGCRFENVEWTLPSRREHG